MYLYRVKLLTHDATICTDLRTHIGRVSVHKERETKYLLRKRTSNKEEESEEVAKYLLLGGSFGDCPLAMPVNGIRSTESQRLHQW